MNKMNNGRMLFRSIAAAGFNFRRKAEVPCDTT